jgi:hypothetical protein
MSWDDFLQEMESELAHEFETATLDEYEALPEGVYKTRIESVELKDGRDVGSHRVVWKFKVLEGEYQGRYIWKNQQMEKGKAKYLTKDIIRCGVTPGTWKELKTTLHSMCDLKVDVEIKNNISNGKSYPNIYIIGLSENELPF